MYNCKHSPPQLPFIPVVRSVREETFPQTMGAGELSVLGEQPGGGDA